MAPEEIGSLLVRVALALLFLEGVWACWRHWQGALADTSLVFRHRPKVMTFAGVATAAVSAVSVLLGVFPRFGALAMAIFLVPAAMIHFAKARQAQKFEAAISPSMAGKADSTARAALSALTASTLLGHRTAGLKNLSLIGPSLYLVLAGAAEPMLIGFGPDWTLTGLLV